jgi:hypothetical protein
LVLDVETRLCTSWIIRQQLWGYKVEEKLLLVVYEQKKKKLNTAALENVAVSMSHNPMGLQGLLEEQLYFFIPRPGIYVPNDLFFHSFPNPETSARIPV